MSETIENFEVYLKEKNIPLTFGTDTHAITEDDELYRDLLLKRKNIVYDDEHGWYLDLPTLEEAKFRLFEQGILSENEINELVYNTFRTKVDNEFVNPLTNGSILTENENDVSKIVSIIV